MSEYDYPVPESGSDKLRRKFREDPLVPIGALGTILFLGAGLASFKRGQAVKSQLMMRGRLVAQAFTVGALCMGVFLRSRNSSKDGKIDPAARSENS